MEHLTLAHRRRSIYYTWGMWGCQTILIRVKWSYKVTILSVGALFRVSCFSNP